jgi:hypothetical protein
MRYYKKAKNAEHLGLRFSISFLQMKNELSAKVTHFSTLMHTFDKKRLKAL